MDGVEFDSGFGGDDTFEGKLIEGGRVEVAGRRLRPLTLAERELVIAAVTDAEHELDECAHLVAQLATTDGSADSDAAVFATEAVALHLAGAAMTGPLVMSSVVARRALGPAADSLDAIEADRLANAIAPPVPENEFAGDGADGGWTTITYDDHAGVVGEPHGARETRDRLAAALLARAKASIPADVARWLLGDADWTDEPDRSSSPGWSSLGANSPDVTHDADPPAVVLDRWGGLVDAGSTPSTRGSGVGATGTPHDLAAGTPTDLTGAPTDHHPPGEAAVGVFGIDRHESEATGAAEPAPTWPLSASAPATDEHRRDEVSPGEHGSRRVPVADSRPTPTEFSRWERRTVGAPASSVAGRPVSPFADEAVDGRPGSTLDARSVHSTGRRAESSDPGTARDTATAGSRTGAATDPDRLAVALHRAADARGLPR